MNNEGLTLYLSACIDELAASGLRHIVISPGSRSTPLAVLSAEHPNIKVWMNIDERSAGFFALGLAKAEREAVALLCTSGTAAANFMPAVVEARLSRVPLIVLTADRPHELRDVGAPQTIDQINLYGSHVKWFMEMPIPEASPAMVKHARTMSARAVATATAKPEGPIHMNFPIREPLLPDLEHKQLFTIGQRDGEYTKVISGEKHLSSTQVEALASQWSSIERGLIVCGPHDEPEFANAVMNLAQALGFPVLADPLSQLRSGVHNKDLLVESYDSFLKDEAAARTLKPELIIRFGAMPVSKPLLQYMNLHESKLVVIDEGGSWREPALLAAEMIYADPTPLCHQITESLHTDILKSESHWLKQWKDINRITLQILNDALKEETHTFEGKVVSELEGIMPEQSVMFVGNSMPIRDVDTFFQRQDRTVRIMGNRGANGIDGLVSTAIGISAANKHHPTLLLLGDLSFYHDMNGLLAAKLHQLSITIVVINNDGGGIFSFLPQSGLPRHFETLFGTPVGLDYKHAAEMYGGKFERTTSWDSFRSAVQASIDNGGLHIIEVPTDRTINVHLHRQIWPKISEAIMPILKEVH